MGVQIGAKLFPETLYWLKINPRMMDALPTLPLQRRQAMDSMLVGTNRLAWSIFRADAFVVNNQHNGAICSNYRNKNFLMR